MKDKPLIIINIALSLVVLFLFLNLLGIQLPSVGKSVYLLDKTKPLCMLEWEKGLDKIDLDFCCLESRKQLICEKEIKQDLDYVCYTGNNNLKYHLNKKAYSYCQQQVIW